MPRAQLSLSECARSVRLARLAGLLGLLLLAAEAPTQIVAAPPVTDERVQDRESQDQEFDQQQELEALHRDVAVLERQANVLKRVVKLVRPAVVHIEVRKGGSSRGQDSRDDPADETGSGVIFKHGGKHYVLTNRHLIRYSGLSEITVTLADSRQLRPTRKWMDSGTDIAVMAIEGKNLFAARVGDSDKAEIGDYVLAIGSPFGLSHSVTFGIISAKGRRDLELATDGVNYQDFMQIDASINPGNSGGPLVSLRGEVIGINTAIASTSGHNEGIGFSIPINMSMIVAKQLIEHGVVVRGFLGVKLDSRFGPAAAAQVGLDRPRGARVTSVSTGTPASVAELQVGDIILQFNGTWIENDSHLVNQVSLTPVGVAVPVTVYRNGRSVVLTVKVGDRRKSSP